jgi:hypothetical protein
VRISFEGPTDTAVCPFLVSSGVINRVVTLTPQMPIIPTLDVSVMCEP